MDTDLRPLDTALDFIRSCQFIPYVLSDGLAEYIGVVHSMEQRYVYLQEFPIIVLDDLSRWVNWTDLVQFMGIECRKWELGIADLVYPEYQGSTW